MLCQPRLRRHIVRLFFYHQKLVSICQRINNESPVTSQHWRAASSSSEEKDTKTESFRFTFSQQQTNYCDLLVIVIKHAHTLMTGVFDMLSLSRALVVQWLGFRRGFIEWEKIPKIRKEREFYRIGILTSKVVEVFSFSFRCQFFGRLLFSHQRIIRFRWCQLNDLLFLFDVVLECNENVANKFNFIERSQVLLKYI